MLECTSLSESKTRISVMRLNYLSCISQGNAAEGFVQISSI